MGQTSEVWIVSSGNSVVRADTADGVQKRLERMMLSSITLCSFNTATALDTVFPVPVNMYKKCLFSVSHKQLPTIWVSGAVMGAISIWEGSVTWGIYLHILHTKQRGAEISYTWDNRTSYWWRRAKYETEPKTSQKIPINERGPLLYAYLLTSSSRPWGKL